MKILVTGGAGFIGSHFAEKALSLGHSAELIDDFNDYCYERGVTIDWTIFADAIHHNRNKVNLLGTEFIALRKAFWEVDEKDVAMEVGTIMLTMGGSDIRNMTPRILKRLRNEFPQVNIDVIIGKGFSSIGQIESLADDKINLIHFPDAEKMKQVMNDSDVAISAGGQTLYELARMGVPTIAVSIIDNQQYDIDGLQKAGFIEYAGAWDDERWEAGIIRAVNVLSDRKERLKRSIIGRKIVDGVGALRIADKIIEVYNHVDL